MPRAGTYIRAADFATTDYVPEPPSDWPPERRERFDRIAAALPRGWWDSSNEPLLREYCCAVESSERLGAIIDSLDIDTVPAAELTRLLAMRDREAKRAIQLARAMRLTRLSLPMPREGCDVPADERHAPWAC
jgi:hypothetical protein